MDERPSHRPTPMPISVLYEDEACIAVDKPAGLLVIPDRYDPTRPTLFNGVWSYLWERAGGDPAAVKPRLVHRLDRDTSGVVLFARTLEAQRALSGAFERGEVRKRYLALVDGQPDDEGVIDLPIGPAPKQSRRTRGRSFVGTPAAKPARTHYRVLERLGDLALVEAEPRTGRTHQIRVHFAAIGHPLAVDPLYGARTSLVVGGAVLGRLALHAERLEIGGLSVRAPLPADLARVLAALRGLP